MGLLNVNLLAKQGEASTIYEKFQNCIIYTPKFNTLHIYKICTVPFVEQIPGGEICGGRGFAKM